MVAASDVEIAARAEVGGAVLVSKDADFVTVRLSDRFAFVWLRRGNATNWALVAWLEARREQVEGLLEGGERFVEVR